MKQGITIGISLAVLMTLATACGPSPAGTSGQTQNTASQNTASTNATGSSSGSTSGSNNATSNTSGTSQAPAIQLTQFNDTQQDGITVMVPNGWTKSRVQGGDYGGWKFVNPTDSSQQVEIVRSSCVGCYMVNGKANPTAPIPEKNPSNVQVTNNGMSATYNFQKTGNSNVGSGLLTTTSNGNGYGYVQVLLPAEDKSFAAQILNSFQLKG
ncbi:hypothetical protein LLE49_24490 [Alicyclobacillus tolerans]|uniref:hypothetical protein n=1 Tax=Alicyclobacillus tolerans TaxID=90970 RepID=UPI001F3F678F|nr:hypothetical protein [Alicyclobacillus tolerans]MCF8567885.1 hypothetical protein [Alicyclobacillus tolerans]